MTKPPTYTERTHCSNPNCQSTDLTNVRTPGNGMHGVKHCNSCHSDQTWDICHLPDDHHMRGGSHTSKGRKDEYEVIIATCAWCGEEFKYKYNPTHCLYAYKKKTCNRSCARMLGMYTERKKKHKESLDTPRNM